MKKILQTAIVLAVALLLSSCGGEPADEVRDVSAENIYKFADGPMPLYGFSGEIGVNPVEIGVTEPGANLKVYKIKVQQLDGQEIHWYQVNSFGKTGWIIGDEVVDTEQVNKQLASAAGEKPYQDPSSKQVQVVTEWIAANVAPLYDIEFRTWHDLKQVNDHWACRVVFQEKFDPDKISSDGQFNMNDIPKHFPLRDYTFRIQRGKVIGVYKGGTNFPIDD